jgi:hypothetical protein
MNAHPEPRHRTTSEIGHLEHGKWSRSDQLPPALHGHGEALRGGYVAPDGTEFLTGYMYTGKGEGVPGLDTGVVYRKQVGGAWKILHRSGPGAWLDESMTGGKLTQIYAASARDIYLVGHRLMHSSGDGMWHAVELPTRAEVTTVWGRGGNDVFAGTMDGVFHWDGKRWSPTGWPHDSETIAGNATTVLVANQHM